MAADSSGRVMLGPPCHDPLDERGPLLSGSWHAVSPRPRRQAAEQHVHEHAAAADGLTVHGFRSCFRDWCAEATAHPREVAEQALAHALPDKVEAAYRRGDMLEKRRRLMEEWAAFCVSPLAGQE